MHLVNSLRHPVMSKLSVVDISVLMYHYVRPLGTRWSERHNVLVLEDFRKQLDHLQKTHQVISASGVLERLSGRAEASTDPRPLVWLTFDDGYSDCIRYVLPELVARGMTASFLVPTAAVWDRILLDVNKIHLILALAPSSADVVAEIRHVWKRLNLRSVQQEDFEAAFERLGFVNAWNDACSHFAKRILQKELLVQDRQRLLDRLMDVFVGESEQVHANDLYLMPDDLLELERAGMDVGSHGHEHKWLGECTSAEQHNDLQHSLLLLETVGLSYPRRVMSYPSGSYNSMTIETVRALGIELGLVNDNALASLQVGTGPWLQVSRIDPMFFDRYFSV
jgi:peptidoglycan/xylan/chitin deacetylase (PgdA/CDA1 family)